MAREVERFLERTLKSLQEFLRLEAIGGLVLMGAAALAMIIANSPLADYYFGLLEIPIGVSIGILRIDKPLLLWINDGLMALFFFLVGLELKREVLEGHLSSLSKVSLPAFAAAGGMFVPAIFYAMLNWNDRIAMRAWAIPAATDIAFALGVLSLLGNRVSTALKAFLLSVAIFDDIGAIVIIAIFYSADISLMSLGIAGVLILCLIVFNLLNVTKVGLYVIIGIPIWVAVLKSGVHATLAGVVVAMFVPLRAHNDSYTPDAANSLRHRIEHSIHPWIAYGVLPVFALANAGVTITGLSMRDLLHPIPLGIVAGLFFGKQVGIMAMCWLAVRAKVASLPDGVKWKHIHGVALLCGIGFTMSLFIASLAFDQGAATYLGLERLGILIGSLVSGLFGYFVLRATLSRQIGATEQALEPDAA
jgi:NhaA family Na+:H+ antiporter